MTDENGLSGLNCPKCGGIVPIPEGQVIVSCPFCEQRSIVAGERGLRRTQIALKIDQSTATKVLEGFFRSSSAIHRGVKSRAKLEECFLVYMPFWQFQAAVMGWVLGVNEIKQNGTKRDVPLEFHHSRLMGWTEVAADVGALGVRQLSLEGVQQDPFDYDALHAAGLVFEPTGSQTDMQAEAEKYFTNQLVKLSKIEKVRQKFIRMVQKQPGLVYYPLWVMRYSFRNRSYQVVVDGAFRRVLYGKAPGNTLYRAFALVGSAAVGAFLMVDVPILLLWFGLKMFDVSDDGVEFILGMVAASFGAGLIMIQQGYKRFRYGEHYEYPEDEKR